MPCYLLCFLKDCCRLWLWSKLSALPLLCWHYLLCVVSTLALAGLSLLHGPGPPPDSHQPHSLHSTGQSAVSHPKHNHSFHHLHPSAAVKRTSPLPATNPSSLTPSTHRLTSRYFCGHFLTETEIDEAGFSVPGKCILLMGNLYKLWGIVDRRWLEIMSSML